MVYNQHTRDTQLLLSPVLVHEKHKKICIHSKKAKWVTNGSCLTSVGHEDFQSCVLQEVASGKDGTDLCEQPFSM